MILEGACFSEKTSFGQLVDLGRNENDQTLYRNGIPYIIEAHDHV